MAKKKGTAGSKKALACCRPLASASPTRQHDEASWCAKVDAPVRKPDEPVPANSVLWAQANRRPWQGQLERLADVGADLHLLARISPQPVPI